MSLLRDERGSWGRTREQTLSNIAVPAVTRPEQAEPARPRDGTMPRLFRALRDYATAHPRVCYALLLAGLLALALWSRYRYVYDQYIYTFGSGDAQLILLKAFLVREGIFTIPPEVVPTPAIFDQPPLIPLLFAGITRATHLSLNTAPFVVVPILTSVALLAFFDLVRRTFSLQTALLATVLFALLPRFSFDSTEPDKAPFVVSFAIVSLWLLALSRERRALVPLAGLVLGLACFSHTTGYFFIPVFAVSYVAFHGLSWRSLFAWQFVLALALPFAFVGAFFYLSNAFAPASISPAEPAHTGLVPEFVERYADTVTALARSGFRDSAWNIYYDAVRLQLTTPVYAAALAGLALAVATLFWYGRTHMLPLVAWLVVVSLCFAVQYPAASHGSRYPSYVTPAFIALAAYAVVAAAGFLLSRVRVRALGEAAAGALVIAAVAYPVYSYATEPNPGLRNIYGGYHEAADFVGSNGLLDDGSHILYVGWPSISHHLLEHDVNYRHQLHSFGFGLRNLDTFTPEFIGAHNIRYYIDTRAGNDGHSSSVTVLTALQRHYRLVFLGTFERRVGNYAALYRIEPARLPAEEAALWRSLLDSEAARLDEMNVAANPALRWSADGALDAWQPNGIVDIAPLDGRAGVFVDNSAHFGGVKQLLDTTALRGLPVTVIAEVRPAGPNPAHSAVVALGPVDDGPFGQVLTPLNGERTLILLETLVPAEITHARLTVATGVEDEGDLAIERVYLVPGSSDALRYLLTYGGQ